MTSRCAWSWRPRIARSAASSAIPSTPTWGTVMERSASTERARAIILPLATETAPYDVVSALSRVDAPLSTLYGLRKDQARAMAIAREAVDTPRAIYGRHPDDRRALKTLASASFHLAWTTPQSERMEQWKLTLGYYDRLLADEPGSAEAQRNVALVEKYIGAVLQPAESAPHLKRAVELDQARLAAAPDNRQAQLDTAISLAGLARVLESQGDLEESGRLLRSQRRDPPAHCRHRSRRRPGCGPARLRADRRGEGAAEAARRAARESPRRRGGENPRGRAPSHQRPLGGNAPRLCVARARPGRRSRGGSPRVVPRVPAGERHVSHDRAGGHRAGIEDRSDARSGRVPLISGPLKVVERCRPPFESTIAGEDVEME